MGNVANVCAGERDKADPLTLVDALHAEQLAEEHEAQDAGQLAGAKDNFVKKPLSRTCTDPLCALVLLFFLGCMVEICLYARGHGDIRKLTSGMDWQGRLCGLDAGVETKPFLYWCQEGDVADASPKDIQTDFPICVSSCPADTGATVMCPQQPDEHKHIEPLQDGGTVTVLTVTQATKNLTTYPTRLIGYTYCVPYTPLIAEAFTTMGDHIRTTLYVDTAVGLLHDLGSLWHVDNVLLFSGVLVGAVVVNFFYLTMVWHCAKIALLFCLWSCVAFTNGLGIFLIVAGLHLDGFDPTGSVAEPLFEYLSQPVAREASIVIGAALIIVGLVLAILACCAKDTIDVAVGCLQVAAKVIFSMPWVLLQTVVCSVLKVALLAVLLYYLLHLVACGAVAQKSIQIGTFAVSGLHGTVSFTTEQIYMLWIFGFGIVWLMEVCNAIQTYAIAYATVAWYYTPKNENGSKRCEGFGGLSLVITGLLNCVVFHSGTVAVGAFLIALVRGLQFLMYLIDKEADAQENRVTQCIARSCFCCLDCFEQCLAGINKNAYIHSAIYSTHFMPSAMQGLDFISRQRSEITVLNGATFIAQLVCVGSITACGVFCSWAVLTEGYISEQTVFNPDMVAGVAGVICLAVSSVFMTLLDDVSDTLLYTFSDHKNTDLSSVPRFAPDNLSDLVDSNRGKHDAHHERRNARGTGSF